MFIAKSNKVEPMISLVSETESNEKKTEQSEKKRGQIIAFVEGFVIDENDPEKSGLEENQYQTGDMAGQQCPVE